MFDDIKIAGDGVPGVVDAGREKSDSPSTTNTTDRTQQVIRAELAWSDHATACGLVVRSSSPVLTLCKRLVDAGFDPRSRLAAWRGGTLCLRVASIGEAAQLVINSKGNGFRKNNAQEVRTASPMRQNGEEVSP